MALKKRWIRSSARWSRDRWFLNEGMAKIFYSFLWQNAFRQITKGNIWNNNKWQMAWGEGKDDALWWIDEPFFLTMKICRCFHSTNDGHQSARVSCTLANGILSSSFVGFYCPRVTLCLDLNFTRANLHLFSIFNFKTFLPLFSIFLSFVNYCYCC